MSPHVRCLLLVLLMCAASPCAAQDLPDSSRSDNYEQRISILEAVGRDTQIWVSVLITIVVVLLGANVGLSIWQVRGMAQKEVEERIRTYDRKVTSLLAKGERSYAKTIEHYKVQLEGVEREVASLSASIDASQNDIQHKINVTMEELDRVTAQLEAEGATILSRLSNELRSIHLECITRYYEAKQKPSDD